MGEVSVLCANETYGPVATLVVFQCLLYLAPLATQRRNSTRLVVSCCFSASSGRAAAGYTLRLVANLSYITRPYPLHHYNGVTTTFHECVIAVTCGEDRPWIIDYIKRTWYQIDHSWLHFTCSLSLLGNKLCAHTLETW